VEAIHASNTVITGLVPVIHVFLSQGAKGVDGRVKPGHDGKRESQ
jgi:hypothetical protein